jgi:putative transposase
MEPERVRKTDKDRLCLTPEQGRVLDTVSWRCRTLYNVTLEERKAACERRRVSVNYDQQKAEPPDLKQVRPEFAEVYAHGLQDVILRLDRAFQADFRRVKKGETPGYPRFQGQGRYNSFTFTEYGDGAVLDGGFLSLSKIGRIRIGPRRPLEGVPKTVTISREVDGWCASVSCADAPAQPLSAMGQEAGIDSGLESFATLSDGARIVNPGWYRRAEQALKTAQRRVSRRQKGSRRRRSAVAQFVNARQTVRRQRQDFHRKRALALVRENDVTYNEDLQTATLVKRHHLARSISDAGWAVSLSILRDKTACAGRSVEAVDPAFTSQRCSGCGSMVATGLSVRWRPCPECRTSLERDHHAARNILALGKNQSAAWQTVQALP